MMSKSLEKVNDVDTYIAKDDEGNSLPMDLHYRGAFGEVEGIVVLTPDSKM